MYKPPWQAGNGCGEAELMAQSLQQLMSSATNLESSLVTVLKALVVGVMVTIWRGAEPHGPREDSGSLGPAGGGREDAAGGTSSRHLGFLPRHRSHVRSCCEVKAASHTCVGDNSPVRCPV